MMKTVAVKIFLTLEMCVMFVTSQETAALQPDAFCEPNKIFYQCKPCPKSCGNQPIPCLKSCQPECYCKPGYVLATPTANTCIPESQCNSCGPNAQWSDCESHCQETCENYLQAGRACPQMCQPGCICNKGYVQYNGQCIRPILCPQRGRSVNPLLIPLLASGVSNSSNLNK
ncbi:hypothetical protein AB205_0098910 [Aquarana catesbeiana]|uniref:TIL domain-containing protein n=1 Tax=Aquarana catesbeiana TaxID=8400 RepID=A0A2G9RMD0_AQUCT|nr:hypothetical protein AB205_0098910 [Aquarana catesbeiana]